MYTTEPENSIFEKSGIIAFLHITVQMILTSILT